jgi:putative NADPH-quinone reductase
MSKKILIVLAHPNYGASVANKAFIESLANASNVTVHNIYEAYPDGKIDVKKEQDLIDSHERVIFQFPTYWFNVPGFLKVWMDEVLAYGWAFGPDAAALAGKEMGVATTTGGLREAYQLDGDRGFTVPQFLLPVVESIKYCSANFIGHAVLHNAFNVTPESLAEAKESYLKLFV